MQGGMQRGERLCYARDSTAMFPRFSPRSKRTTCISATAGFSSISSARRRPRRCVCSQRAHGAVHFCFHARRIAHPRPYHLPDAVPVGAAVGGAGVRLGTAAGFHGLSSARPRPVRSGTACVPGIFWHARPRTLPHASPFPCPSNQGASDGAARQRRHSQAL